MTTAPLRGSGRASSVSCAAQAMPLLEGDGARRLLFWRAKVVAIQSVKPLSQPLARGASIGKLVAKMACHIDTAALILIAAWPSSR